MNTAWVLEIPPVRMNIQYITPAALQSLYHDGQKQECNDIHNDIVRKKNDEEAHVTTKLQTTFTLKLT